jgi:hypothetical protein
VHLAGESPAVAALLKRDAVLFETIESLVFFVGCGTVGWGVAALIFG